MCVCVCVCVCVCMCVNYLSYIYIQRRRLFSESIGNSGTVSLALFVLYLSSVLWTEQGLLSLLHLRSGLLSTVCFVWFVLIVWISVRSLQQNLNRHQHIIPGSFSTCLFYWNRKSVKQHRMYSNSVKRAHRLVWSCFWWWYSFGAQRWSLAPAPACCNELSELLIADKLPKKQQLRGKKKKKDMFFFSLTWGPDFPKYIFYFIYFINSNQIICMLS